MSTSTPMKKISIEQLKKAGLVASPRVSKVGKLILDENNELHRRL